MKRFIAWARVSSQRQAEEGWSLDHQKQRLAEHAVRLGGEVAKMYVVTETASKHQEREIFRGMLAYARLNASRLDGLLVMKIDRAARNLPDFVQLEALEQDHGVPLISVTQQTENTAAGRMMRRTLATWAAYFTEELSENTRRAMRRRAEAGLFVTLAPYGYRNARGADKRRTVEVDPIEAEAVRRVFHLYAYHGHTLDTLGQALVGERIEYKPARPAWTRSKLYELLRDRSYIGDVDHLGQWYPGTHPPLVERATFDRVQVLLGKGVRRCHEMLYAGELVTCGHCGRPISGESKTKPRKGGERTYVYYRCARYNVAGHPRVRLNESDLDRQVFALFDRLRIADDDEREWWGDVIRAKTRGSQDAARERRDRLSADLTRCRSQKDVLLNLRLNGEIEPDTYAAKSTELRDREARCQLELEAAGRDQSESADLALKVFELSQSLRERWVTADVAAKRSILETVCLNFRLDGVTLVPSMRKPFDVIAEGLDSLDSAQDRI